jgi:hypothetical protein
MGVIQQTEISMAYEYPVVEGTVQLIREGQRWAFEFNGSRRGRWQSPDDAAMAAARHRTGLPEWDQSRLRVSEGLLRWRPLGDSL